MRILFVCTGNVDRSKTAEELFKSIKGLETKSAGTSVAATIPLKRELVAWADKIFVMEHKHERAVLKLDPAAGAKVACLRIPDVFYYGQPELKRLLKQKLCPYLSDWAKAEENRVMQRTEDS